MRAAALRIDTVRKVLAHLNASLRADGIDEALRGISGLIGEVVTDTILYFGFYRREGPPIVLETDLSDDWDRRYPNGYYLLDPTYEAFLSRNDSACLLPQDVFPRDFRRSEFYLSYCRPARMVDEVCFLLYQEPETAAYVSVMRLGDVPVFSRSECQRLAMALPAVDAAMRHVWRLHERSARAEDGDARAMHRHMSAAYREFGSTVLSEREAEVTRLLLKGLAPKVIGRMLGIAPGTVRNHIKSIYIKLQVRSQPELMAHFFEVLGNPLPAGAEAP